MGDIISYIFVGVSVVLLIFSILRIFFAVAFGIGLFLVNWKLCVKLSEPALTQKQQLRFQQMNEWAIRNGFHHVGFFQMPSLILAGWENPEKSSMLTQFFYPQNPDIKGLYFEISTLFDNNITLETGNAYDMMLLPVPPGNYLQSFPQKNPEEIFKIHNESIRYLTEYGGVRLTPFHPDLPWNNSLTEPSEEQQPSAFEVDQNSGILSETKYLCSLLFYPLRAVYWYLWRRIFWVNKTIQEQVEMGRLVLPQELPPDYEKYHILWSPEKQTNR